LELEDDLLLPTPLLPLTEDEDFELELKDLEEEIVKLDLELELFFELDATVEDFELDCTEELIKLVELEVMIQLDPNCGLAKPNTPHPYPAATFPEAYEFKFLVEEYQLDPLKITNSVKNTAVTILILYFEDLLKMRFSFESVFCLDIIIYFCRLLLI
jgi:hypothetical protein